MKSEMTARWLKLLWMWYQLHMHEWAQATMIAPAVAVVELLLQFGWVKAKKQRQLSKMCRSKID